MSTAPRATQEGGKPPQQPARRVMLPGGGPGGRRPQFNLFRDVGSELKKVVWPTRDQVINLSIIVIIASIAMGIALGFVDWLFTNIVEMFLATGSTGIAG